MNYAHGLVFRTDFERVVITEGARQEKDERRARDTMSRFYEKQYGIETKPEDWTMFAEFLKPDKEDGIRRVYFFRVSDDDTKDDVKWHDVEALDEVVDPVYRVLVPLAVNWSRLELDMVIMMHESARSRRKK